MGEPVVVATADTEAQAWALTSRLARRLVAEGLADRYGVRPEQHAGGWWVLLVPRL